eukprot:gene8217-1483_t
MRLQFFKNPSVLGHSTPLRNVVAEAKKGKPKMKKGSRKEEGEKTKEAPPGRATNMQYGDPEVRGILFSLVTSYSKQFGTFLMDEIELEELPKLLYEAPFACVAHDRAPKENEEPIFTYANRAALELWDAKWEELVEMTSTSSTGGFDAGEGGWRVSSQGRKFKALNPKVVTIDDWGGATIGEALIFDKFLLEGNLVGDCVGPDVVQIVLDADAEAARLKLPATPEEIEAADKAVNDQAIAIQKMKEALQDGFKNKDPEVLKAVAQLMVLKEELKAIRARG